MKHIFSFLLFFLFCSVALAKEEKLYLYTYPDYVPDSIIKKFTRETGIKVIISTCDNNETLYAKIKLLGQSSEYDVVIPSTYYISKMRKAGLLAKLDKNKIPNLRNIDPKFLNKAYDLNNEYSIPYLWGSTGIAYNSKYVKEEVDSWNILFSNKYAGRVYMIDDVRDVFFIALTLLGYSGNDINEAHIEEAFKKLKPMVPNVKTWNTEAIKTYFIDEEVVIGAGWSGFIYTASLENPNIKFAYPKERFPLWLDGFAILKSAKNVDNAHKFINFIHQPEISKEISETIGFATPNMAAIKLLPSHVRDNQIIYPSEEILARGEIQEDIGASISIYEKYWEMLKTGIEVSK